MKSTTGGEKGRTTSVTTTCMSTSWKVEVCQKRKLLEDVINQQPASITSTSSTKQHTTVALDRQMTTATESGTTVKTKHAILLFTYHHLRVAQLHNRRNLNNLTLEAPGTQPLETLLCGFSWRSNRDHHHLLLV